MAATLGYFRHPAEGRPRPPQACDDLGLDLSWKTEELLVYLKSLPRCCRNYFVDGSKYDHPVADWNRVAWGLAVFAPDGTILRSFGAPVSRMYPQTSQAGEFSAMLAASMLPPGLVFTDCGGVEVAWNSEEIPNNPCVLASNIYSGIISRV